MFLGNRCVIVCQKTTEGRQRINKKLSQKYVQLIWKALIDHCCKTPKTSEFCYMNVLYKYKCVQCIQFWKYWSPETQIKLLTTSKVLPHVTCQKKETQMAMGSNLWSQFVAHFLVCQVLPIEMRYLPFLPSGFVGGQTELIHVYKTGHHTVVNGWSGETLRCQLGKCIIMISYRLNWVWHCRKPSMAVKAIIVLDKYLNN